MMMWVMGGGVISGIYGGLVLTIHLAYNVGLKQAHIIM